MSKMRGVSATILIVSIFLLVIYDFTVWVIGGHTWTFSDLINTWAFETHPMIMFLVGFLNGALFVHFFRWGPRPMDDISP